MLLKIKIIVYVNNNKKKKLKNYRLLNITFEIKGMKKITFNLIIFIQEKH